MATYTGKSASIPRIAAPWLAGVFIAVAAGYLLHDSSPVATSAKVATAPAAAVTTTDTVNPAPKADPEALHEVKPVPGGAYSAAHNVTKPTVVTGGNLGALVTTPEASGRLRSHRSQLLDSSHPGVDKRYDLEMPDWERIIAANGSSIDRVGASGRQGSNGIPDYVEIYSGIEAGFIEEVLSNGIATDMSALLIAPDVSDEVLYNGAVRAAHDLGNALYLLAIPPDGRLRYYIGVERLRSDLPTFIEFELNQALIRVGSGVPWWTFQGARLDGDLLVRFNLIAGNITSVELAEWDRDGYRVFESDTQGVGVGCHDRFGYIYCQGPPPLDRSRQVVEVWDEDFAPVEPTFADSFIELGLDLDRLGRPGTEFKNLIIRTPEDVVLTSFRGIEQPAANGIGSP